MAARAVPWVAHIFYGAVLLAGLIAGVGPGWRLVAFVLGLAVLAAVDVLERLQYDGVTPRRAAITLLVVRLALTVGVLAVDDTQLSRALLVLIPFQAYFTLGHKVSLFMCGALLGTATFLLGMTDPSWLHDTEALGDLLMLNLGMAMAWVMAAAVVDAQNGRARLERAQGELAELATAAERTRLAREIHDSLGHHLTAISVQLEKSAAFRQRDPGAADQALADARQSARLALVDVRGAVRALRDPQAAMPLATLLEGLAARLTGPKLRITAEVVGEESGHLPATMAALYRVAQEGLTNALKHSQARHAAVRVQLEPEAATMEISDDGRGLPEGGHGPVAAGVVATAAGAVPATGPPAPGPGVAPLAGAGFGLTGMRERVEALGGRFELLSSPGSGTTVRVTVPT